MLLLIQGLHIEVLHVFVQKELLQAMVVLVIVVSDDIYHFDLINVTTLSYH